MTTDDGYKQGYDEGHEDGCGAGLVEAETELDDLRWKLERAEETVKDLSAQLQAFGPHDRAVGAAEERERIAAGLRWMAAAVPGEGEEEASTALWEAAGLLVWTDV